MWDLIVSVPDHCLSFYIEDETIQLYQSLYDITGCGRFIIELHQDSIQRNVV